jgi:hypothetical protein
MPKTGKRIKIGSEEYLVKRQNPLQESIIAENSTGEEVVLAKRDWKLFQPVKKETTDKKKEMKSGEQSETAPPKPDRGGTLPPVVNE